MTLNDFNNLNEWSVSGENKIYIKRQLIPGEQEYPFCLTNINSKVFLQVYFTTEEKLKLRKHKKETLRKGDVIKWIMEVVDKRFNGKSIEYVCLKTDEYDSYFRRDKNSKYGWTSISREILK